MPENWGARPLRVLLVHNHYQQRGGEDQVFESEAALLEQGGHEVLRYELHNDAISGLGSLDLAQRAVWSRPAYRAIRKICRDRRPDIAHFHNTLPLVSPAGYYAAKAEGAAVVQTLHNYRIGCAAGTFFRVGRPCERCLDSRSGWPGIAHGCYRGSSTASAAVVAMTSLHRMLGTWISRVDRYIALTAFARTRFIRAGLPDHKIVIKPNFVAPDPGPGPHSGRYALFVGRLAPEKGIATLLRAWSLLQGTYPLRIVGSGPLEHLRSASPTGVTWAGQQARQEIFRAMQEASFLVFPSEWYETFGLTIIEAFATGLPVIAADLGAAAEIVEHGRTGLLYPPGDSAELASQVRWAVANPLELRRMGTAARDCYIERYSRERNYDLLLDIYRSAAGLSAQRVAAPAMSLRATRAR